VNLSSGRKAIMPINKLCLVILTTFILSISAFAQSNSVADKTVIKDPAAKAKLLGQHKLSLQWISWDYFGKAIVTDTKGVMRVKGEQKSRKDDDYLKVDGFITLVDTKEFKFNGTIIMRVSHINGGEPCKREGEMTFRITGNRKYWRLQEMDNPCDQATDYVDIFFR
jgi:hypothetical protein